MNAEMIKKLKENERPLFVLMRDDPEMVEAFKKYQKDVGWFDGNCVDSVGAVLFDSPCGIYRLRPDYGEPVERWFVYIKNSPNIGELYQPIINLSDFEADKNWLELKTQEELEYIKARPEGCRLGIPKDCHYWNIEGILSSTDNTRVGVDFISGYRWIKDVPKEQFVEYPIAISKGLTYGYRCTLKHFNNSEVPLHKLPSCVGFAGVQFDGCSGWAMSLSMFTDGKGGMSIFESITYNKIAIPLKARFQVSEVGE